MRANTLAIGIAIQDVPEGPVLAAALLAAVAGHSAAVLPWGLGVAAGAMLYVASHQIIPDSHRKGRRTSPPSA